MYIKRLGNEMHFLKLHFKPNLHRELKERLSKPSSRRAMATEVMDAS
jgi:hypothetical protein